MPVPPCMAQAALRCCLRCGLNRRSRQPMPRIQKLHHACSEYHAKCAEDWAVPAACCAASADIQGHCRQASSGGRQTAVASFFDGFQCNLCKLLDIPPTDLTSVGWMMRATQLMRRRDHWPRGNSWSCTAAGTMHMSFRNVQRPLPPHCNWQYQAGA